jgi:hypothetical protein
MYYPYIADAKALTMKTRKRRARSVKQKNQISETTDEKKGQEKQIPSSPKTITKDHHQRPPLLHPLFYPPPLPSTKTTTPPPSLLPSTSTLHLYPPSI